MKINTETPMITMSGTFYPGRTMYERQACRRIVPLDTFGIATGYVCVMTGQQIQAGQGKSMRTSVELSKSAKPAASARDYELFAKHGEEDRDSRNCSES